MTAGPGDQGAADAAAGGHLRASNADRERVIAVLKAAFVRGMLTKEELAARVGHGLVSRTYGELAALTGDLPAGLIAAPPPGKTVPAQASPPANKGLLWGSWVMVLLAIGFMLGAFPANPMGALTVGVAELPIPEDIHVPSLSMYRPFGLPSPPVWVVSTRSSLEKAFRKIS